jgi:hypothetical protein
MKSFKIATILGSSIMSQPITGFRPFLPFFHQR